MKITNADKIASGRYAGTLDDRYSLVEQANMPFSISIESFEAGLLHERAKYVKLVEALKLIAWHHPDCDCMDSREIAANALKELEGE